MRPYYFPQRPRRFNLKRRLCQMLLTCLEKYLLLQVKDLHRMNCRCQMQLIKVGEHMNRQDKIWIDEGSRKVFFSKYLNSELNINFSKISLPPPIPSNDTSLQLNQLLIAFFVNWHNTCFFHSFGKHSFSQT